MDNNVKINSEYEYCPRCEANLTLQKGYRNDLPYWVCKGCGEMLINPANEDDSDIVWVCDGCGDTLNLQEGFSEECGTWKCTECGYENKIDKSEIYLSEDEYQAELMNPYRGISDEDALKLMRFEEVEGIDGRYDVILVRNIDDGKLYVKKLYSTYNAEVIRHLIEHPVRNMPKIHEAYEGLSHLITVEDYIEGITLENLLSKGLLGERQALGVIRDICLALTDLHSMEPPVIHRDVKPLNIIITDTGKAILLDVNVAKWYDSGQTEDTMMIGTLNYAAPEQFGFGSGASSVKSDVYAAGVILNRMVTGKLPKEKRAPEKIWPVVEKCTRLNADERYSAAELLAAVENLL